MAEKTPQSDIGKLSFEEALKELEDLVRQLEKGDSRLEDAIAAYERGAALKRHCEAKLLEARMKVERITFGADGGIGTEPVENP